MDKSFIKYSSILRIPPSKEEYLYFYILSQQNSEFGVYGITISPFRRVGEYLKKESECINFTKRLETKLYYGKKQDILDVETKLKAKLKHYKKYDHLLVINKKANQVEFFPSSNRNEIEEMVNDLVKSSC
jgi:hypothetical protein